MSNNKKKEVVIGIDLGTTNCCVAYSDGSSIRVFENSEGFRTTPSVLAYQNGKFVVGRSAKREIGINPDVVSSIKRLMGTRKTVNIGGRELSPEQVSAEFIRNQVEVASEKLDEKIKKLVITVPAYFDDVQRQATKDAAKIAGFEAIRIISEPTAAALAYGLEKEAKQKNIVENVMVYDLGGGTFDCSIITIDIGEQDESGMIQVKSTAGINDLGGDDYDFKIFEFVSKEIKRETRNIIDENSKFSNDEGIKKAYYRILEASQEAKHTLSSSLEAYINLPFLFEKESLQYTITRSQFENLTENLTKKTIVRANDALKEANLKIDQIDKILLVGGSTR
ncbi:MAG TPA: Hsp70 family protein, partial [Mycoplasmatales bacterium]|nr:Hsp70 family protein [Mycoplasmatales bacterium]